MHKVMTLLSERLDQETKARLERRVDSLIRGIKYEIEKNNLLKKDITNGWSIEQLEIICCLNAFYQIVLGPLAASTRNNLHVGLVRDIPLQYGKVRITSEEVNRIAECHTMFKTITNNLGIDFFCLQSAHSQDLLYNLTRNRGYSE